MCTDFGPDRLRFAGLIPKRVQKVNTLEGPVPLDDPQQKKLYHKQVHDHI